MDTGNGRIRYEKRDLDTDAVIRAGIILGIVALVATLSMLPLIHHMEARWAKEAPPPPPMAWQGAERRPPAPRLQERPFEDVRELRAEEKEVLTTYGWIDKKQGIVRIPVEKAMQILVERGLPARAAATKSPEPAGGEAR